MLVAKRVVSLVALRLRFQNFLREPKKKIFLTNGSSKKRFFDQRITKKAFFDQWITKNTHFPQKNCPTYCFLQYIGALRELVAGFAGFTGFSGFTGNGVRNHGSDPPFHGQEFSDDGSSQQTPSK